MRTRKRIFAIDPGTDQSAFVWYDGNTKQLLEFGIEPNEELRLRLSTNEHPRTLYAIEMVACYGMSVGRDIFETCLWIGRFMECVARWEHEMHQVYRKEVKLELCGTPQAKDGNIRQAIIDIFPQDGGGKTKQIGTKANPGSLYGVKSHLWQALAVAISFDTWTHER